MTRRLGGDRLVLATHNSGKLREIGAFLEPYGIAVMSAAALGLAEPEETESTFAGNAALKARFAANASGLPALADDSGIAVDGLDGAPGVYTADWAEGRDGRDYLKAMRRVWDELEARGVAEPRMAAFVCTLCLAWPDGDEEIFEGRVTGRLVWPIRGDHGFGFDPMFVPDGHTRTFGEMAPEEKQRLSHRRAAFESFRAGCLGG